MRFQFVTLLISAFVVSTTVLADDWPQFRGPAGQGHGKDTGLPLTWSETDNVTWKIPVEGTAWSSPVVCGKTIWMTTAIATMATPKEAKKELDSLSVHVPSAQVARRVILKAVCIDRDSGRLLRSVTLFDIDEPVHICSVNSYASPTPVVEKGRLYCDFGTMGVACLDTSTGKILWSRDLPIEHQVGPGSSPILHGDLLVLVRDGCMVQYVIALDKNTGKTAWNTDRPPIDATSPDLKKAFSTPLIIDTAGGKQMVIPAAQWIVTYDPDSGKPIWRVNTGGTFSNVTRPVFGHGLVFITTAFGGSKLLAIKVDGQGDVTDTHVAWQQRKTVPRLPSPLLVSDELFILSDSGVATCLDARTGKVNWVERVLGNCSASPVLVDGRIYLFGEDGRTVVLRAGKQFANLAENRVDGRIKASVAIADGAFFLRTDTHLYRIGRGRVVGRL